MGHTSFMVETNALTNKLMLVHVPQHLEEIDILQEAYNQADV